MTYADFVPLIALIALVVSVTFASHRWFDFIAGRGPKGEWYAPFAFGAVLLWVAGVVCVIGVFLWSLT